MTRSILIILIIATVGSFAIEVNATPLSDPDKTTQEVGIVINRKVKDILRLRFKKKYEIFNSKGKTILKGESKSIDVSKLPKGKYFIKFDGDSNQIELIEKN